MWQVDVFAFAAPVGRVACACVDHAAHGFHVGGGVGAAQVGCFDVPFFGVVVDDDAAGFGWFGVLLLFGFDFAVFDFDEPEEGAGCPMQSDATFEHAGVAEQPGGNGG